MGEKKRRIKAGLGPAKARPGVGPEVGPGRGPGVGPGVGPAAGYATGSAAGSDHAAATLEAVRLLQAGDSGGARALYRALAEQNVSHPDALHRLGFLAIQFGEPDRAETFLRRAISLVPGQPWYCNTLSIGLRHQRKYAAAIDVLREALAGAPEQHEIWGNLGNVLREEGLVAESVAAYMEALRLAPNIGYYWSAFSICVRNLKPAAPVAPDFRRDMERAIVHPEVSPSDIAPAAIETLKADPVIRSLIDGNWKPDAEALFDPMVARALGDPLLLRVLESAVVADVEMELLLTNIRRHHLLQGAGSGNWLMPLEAAAAIARQCFLNEYAWAETQEESQAVASLVSALSADPPQPALSERSEQSELSAMRLATLAAYRPLHAVPGIESSTRHPDAFLEELLAQQVREPMEEQRLRGELRVLAGEIRAASGAVREQYESNPYPRWARVGHFEHARPAPDVLAEMFPGRDFGAMPRSGLRVLVAGCGTGRHSIQSALRFADARVLAFDLSLSSLAYAWRKTREMGLQNIEYRQGDILALGGVSENFDVIESVGVLHHLRDPLAGWRALLDRLKPDGVMCIGLYSELARRHIVSGRTFAASHGFTSEPDSLRALRRSIIESRDVGGVGAVGEAGDLEKVTHCEDFFSLSGCRDLLLHVQEQRFTANDVAAMLRTLELEFLGFQLPSRAVEKSYRGRFPEDTGMTDLSRWDEFERGEPGTFFGMYNFWVRRQKRT